MINLSTDKILNFDKLYEKLKKDKDPMSLSTYVKSAHLVLYSKFNSNLNIHV